jgi:hypothetical protein
MRARNPASFGKPEPNTGPRAPGRSGSNRLVGELAWNTAARNLRLDRRQAGAASRAPRIGGVTTLAGLSLCYRSRRGLCRLEALAAMRKRRGGVGGACFSRLARTWAGRRGWFGALPPGVGGRGCSAVLRQGQAVVGLLLSGAPYARCAAPSWACGILPGGWARPAQSSAECRGRGAERHEKRRGERRDCLLDGRAGDVRERDHWKISVVQSPPWRRTSWARAGPVGRLWKSTKKSWSTCIPPSGEQLTRSSHERSWG